MLTVNLTRRCTPSAVILGRDQICSFSTIQVFVAQNAEFSQFYKDGGDLNCVST